MMAKKDHLNLFSLTKSIDGGSVPMSDRLPMPSSIDEPREFPLGRMHLKRAKYVVDSYVLVEFRETARTTVGAA